MYTYREGEVYGPGRERYTYRGGRGIRTGEGEVNGTGKER